MLAHFGTFTGNVLVFLSFFLPLSGFCGGVITKRNTLLGAGACSKVHVEILVSPLARKGSLRRLEVQWEYAPQGLGDWIGVFRSDPLSPSGYLADVSPVEVIPVTSIHGWANTSIFEDHIDPENLGFQNVDQFSVRLVVCIVQSECILLGARPHTGCEMMVTFRTQPVDAKVTAASGFLGYLYLSCRVNSLHRFPSGYEKFGLYMHIYVVMLSPVAALGCLSNVIKCYQFFFTNCVLSLVLISFSILVGINQATWHSVPVNHTLTMGKCLSYFAGYFDQFNFTLAATCLRIEPDWMWNSKNEIGPRKLRHVFIPGTHDSAAYGEFDEHVGDTRVKKYSITQDESILGQLIYGTRYIDLRVGYYVTSNEPWWANHGVVRIHPLRIILKDIRTFINNTKEIVILDVQEFPVGFKAIEIHHALVNLLKVELGDLTVPPTYNWESTFEQIWNTGKRLIIGYDKRSIAENSNFLWGPVQQQWGNVQTLNDLYTYLAKVIERPPLRMWSAMAELTPTTLDIFLDRLKGLRVMAETVNHNVTEWFRRRDWQPKSNIVTVDFIRNTGIIRSAIEWNNHQGRC